MIRRSVAGGILGVSLLLGSLGWSGLVAQRTVFDADRSGEIADELLENDEVRSQIEENLAGAISNLVPPEAPVSDEVIRSVSSTLVDDPAVQRILRRAMVDTHAAFLGEGRAPEVIDLTEVATAARASLVQASPQLEVLLPESPVLTVPLPTEHVPDASPIRTFLRTAVPILIGAAVLGAVLALVTTTNRPGILRRAGFWALATTAVYLVIGLLVPWLLRQYAPDQAEVLAALLAALLGSTLLPSIVLAGVGVALLITAALWFASGREPDRRAPHPDAPHRRQAAAMDRARTRRTPAPRTRRPAPSATRAQPPATGPQTRPGAERTRPVPPVQPAPPPGGRTSAPSSPYPDGPGRGAGSATPAPASSRSVYADPSPAPADQRWVEGQGWVLDPRHRGPVPEGARWVDGVGYVLPGPPPGPGGP